MPRFANWGIRIWRLAALVAVAWLLHQSANHRRSEEALAPFGIREVQRFFPEAHRFSESETHGGIYEAFDSHGRGLGTLLTTSPQSDFIVGYVAPNNVLVALDPKGRILGAELLASGDTRAHIADVESNETFWQQFIGWTPSQHALPKVDAVAGSTLTSLGIVEALQNRLSGRTDSMRFPDPLSLTEVKQIFSGAATLEPVPKKAGWHSVKDSSGKLLGFAVRTSPASDYNLGHSGPTESLVAVAPDMQQIRGVRIRRSYDTPEYVENVRDEVGYLQELSAFSVDDWARIDLKKSGLEGVSGATETSFAVAEGIRRRFATTAAEKIPPPGRFQRRDLALLGIIAGSLVIGFSGLRTRRWIRRTWQVLLIAVFGIWLGDLLSLALLNGWARHGVVSETPALALLGAAALLVPWATSRQLYCNEICPHGAAQEWLGKFKKLHIRIPPSLGNFLRFVPGVLLILAVFLAVFLPQFDLATLEPFDAWALRGAWAATTFIAIGGLVASLFVPMAYCRFGCPTGALLRFMKTAGDSEKFSLRDGVALGLLIAAGMLMAFPKSGSRTESEAVTLRGTAFGSTWKVKLRTPVRDPDGLQRRLDEELKRIESTLSHWRPESATARFNAARTTYPIEAPGELIMLVSKAQLLSASSHGAFDITVAPLVRAWGFGPGEIPAAKPSAIEIERLREFTGWEKLTIDPRDLTLRKSHPDLQLDLGALLQGYAADQMARVLSDFPGTDYLIEVGGELLARGEWQVAIENPMDPAKPIRRLQLKDAALATSGTYRAGHSDKESRWSHIIDPSTGSPVSHDTVMVSVSHKSCLEADALSTTLLVLGYKEGGEFAKTNNIAALFVTPENSFSHGFPEEE